MTRPAAGWALVIFDCDGVLVDSEPASNRVFHEALRELGLELSYAEVCREFIGLSMADCLARVERRLGRPVPQDFEARLEERTFDAFRRELQPIPGVTEALARIDVPTCVASSGEPRKMRLTLGLTGLLERFEGRLFSALEVPHGKPHPDLFLHAARRMGAAPGDSAVVEDSLPGVVAARSAGMTVFGYARDGAVAAELARAGAVIFDDMRRLPELLAGAAPGIHTRAE